MDDTKRVAETDPPEVGTAWRIADSDECPTNGCGNSNHHQGPPVEIPPQRRLQGSTSRCSQDPWLRKLPLWLISMVDILHAIWWFTMLKSPEGSLKQCVSRSPPIGGTKIARSRKGMGKSSTANIEAGWWFGTFFIFPYIGLLIIPTDFHIFQRGGPTTNQILFVAIISLEVFRTFVFLGMMLPKILTKITMGYRDEVQPTQELGRNQLTNVLPCMDVNGSI